MADRPTIDLAKIRIYAGIATFLKANAVVFTQSIILIKDLYDPNDDSFLNDKGKKILEKMKSGEMQGTFYVNIVNKKADSTDLVTKNKCYYPD